jgi:hypothetical protein
VCGEDDVPTGRLIAGSFDGWGCAHMARFGLGNAAGLYV